MTKRELMWMLANPNYNDNDNVYIEFNNKQYDFCVIDQQQHPKTIIKLCAYSDMED